MTAGPNSAVRAEIADANLSQSRELSRALSNGGGSRATPIRPAQVDPPGGHLNVLDPRLASLATHYLGVRRSRAELFAPRLFSDPAWDLLLDLFVSEAEGRKVSASDAAHAAQVPSTTGLRWIDSLSRAGLLECSPDPLDRRRRLLRLTPRSRAAVSSWLDAAFTCPVI